MTTPTAPTEQGAPRASMRRYVLTVGGLVAGALLVSGALLAARWAQVPDVVASHWGRDGVDATQSKAGNLALLWGLVVGLAVLFAVLARFIHPDGRRYLAAATGFTTGLVTVIVTGSMLAQVGLTDPYAASIPGVVTALAVVVSLVAGTLLWWLNPPPPVTARRTNAALPAGAPVVALEPGERLAWVGHTAPLHWGGMLGLGLVLLVAAVVSWLASPWLVLLPVAVAVLVVSTLNARVVVNGAGVRVSSGPARWISLPLAQIQSADAVEVWPVREYGGYGLRFSGQRRGFVTRAGSALRLHVADGSTTEITLDDAEHAAAVVNTLVQQTAVR